MKDKKISLRLDEADLNKLIKMAGKGESLSAYIRAILKQHISNYKKEKKGLLSRFRKK